MDSMAGYSGTRLAKKLGITEGVEVVLVNAPANYAGLVAIPIKYVSVTQAENRVNQRPG